MLDANEAVASVAYRASEVIAIYPITPSSGMAEVCDEWAAADKPNIWSDVPEVVQLQSEGGVAGPPRLPPSRCAVHDFYRISGAATDDPQHV